MIITGDIRGNGPQLYSYVLTMGDNEDIFILDVDGHKNASPEQLRQFIIGVELTAELTKSDMPFLSVQLSPAYGEDTTMNYERWNLAADILATGTDFEGQRRAIILHKKKGRTHAHVIYERYNHDTGKMVDNKYSKFKMSDARNKIELALGHKLTPKRNPQRFALKENMTALWLKHTEGKEFIKAAHKEGYIIAQGTPKRPFRVVDSTGRSFDLVRQLENIKTKDVRARLRNEPLITEKQAIEQIREQQAGSTGKREKQGMELKLSAVQIAEEFADNRNKVTQQTSQQDKHELAEHKSAQAFNAFKESSEVINKKEELKESDEQQRKEAIAKQFADNKQTLIEQQAQQEILRQQIQEQQERMRQRQRQRKPRR